MATCVPFCSWYTQVTSRCWMPFSQVAEQGLHGPATHLPRERQDSEQTKGLPDRSWACCGREGGRHSFAVGFGDNFRLSELSEWFSGLLSTETFLHPTPHVRLLLNLCLHPAVLGHLCSGMNGHEAGHIPAEALGDSVACLSLFLLSAVRMAG